MINKVVVTVAIIAIVNMFGVSAATALRARELQKDTDQHFATTSVCAENTIPISVKLIKLSKDSNAWQSASYTISKVDDVAERYPIHSKSFEGNGLFETHSVCLDSQESYELSVVSSSAGSSAKDIGVEVCGQSFVGVGSTSSFVTTTTGCVVESESKEESTINVRKGPDGKGPAGKGPGANGPGADGPGPKGPVDNGPGAKGPGAKAPGSPKGGAKKGGSAPSKSGSAPKGSGSPKAGKKGTKRM